MSLDVFRSLGSWANSGDAATSPTKTSHRNRFMNHLPFNG